MHTTFNVNDLKYQPNVETKPRLILMYVITHSNIILFYTGWPRKNATLSINNFKKTRDRMKKLCTLLRINSFSSKMTPRSLILMKAFWFYGRFSEAMSVSRFALLSQKSQFTYRQCSIVWLPRVKCLLLLCKAKPAWIKRSIHYVTLPH